MAGHFYTVDPAEVSSAIRGGYGLEGIACYVYDPSSNYPGTTALFRLYFTTSDLHFYTVDPTEALNVLKDTSVREEGTACFVYGSRQSNTTDLFRRYNPTSGEHFYTADPNEAQSVLNEGFQDEGTACFVYDPGQAPAGAIPLYRLFQG